MDIRRLRRRLLEICFLEIRFLEILLLEILLLEICFLEIRFFFSNDNNCLLSRINNFTHYVKFMSPFAIFRQNKAVF